MTKRKQPVRQATLRRLRAMPFAMFCRTQCKTKTEKRRFFTEKRRLKAKTVHLRLPKQPFSAIVRLAACQCVCVSVGVCVGRVRKSALTTTTTTTITTLVWRLWRLVDALNGHGGKNCGRRAVSFQTQDWSLGGGSRWRLLRRSLSLSLSLSLSGNDSPRRARRALAPATLSPRPALIAAAPPPQRPTPLPHRRSLRPLSPAQ